MRYILEYLLTLSPLILIVRLLWNRPQKQYTTMRCPTCGEVPWMTGSFWFTDKGLSAKCGDIIYLESESTQQEN